MSGNQIESKELVKMFTSLLQWKNNVLTTLLLDDVGGMEETSQRRLREERRERSETRGETRVMEVEMLPQMGR